MDDNLYVLVPRDLWQLLEQDDFGEVELTRSSDQWAQIVTVALSIGERVVADLSSLVTVYVARDEIRAFARRLAFWVHHHTPADDARTVLTFTRDVDATRVMVECSNGSDGRPAVDVEKLTQAVGSLLAIASDVPGPAGPGTSGNAATTVNQ
jgi:hypothetical protein